ncbi:unnamed protein product [Rotaria sordida]|uniref:Alpha/beta hydrolase fold-3 domain-containing protein n=1 Tax=Rotaria sordida TaxID=392033 RepID=A0A814X1S5_9BILA|nr:unnamed protein product [Rotaria sordida]CAF1491228.1 unnamed protein product [Rotaria sordida]
MLSFKSLLEPDLLVDPLEMARKLRLSFLLGTMVPRPYHCQVNKQVYEYEGHKAEAYWINHHAGKEQRNTDQIVIYLHGGAYVRGDINGFSGLECHLSRLFNMSLLHLEYRLVPEHPLPAAVDDTLALYRALLHDGISSSRLIIMGDSAGGGLTLLTVQALLDRHLPIPRAVITMSPWTDLSLSGESYKRNRLTDVMLRLEYISWSVERALGPNHAQLVRYSSFHSPLFGSFQGFPPMYITVGTAELLEDDSRQVADKAQNAGVDVTLEVGLYMMHVHPIFFSFCPEARNTLDNIRQWVEAKFQGEINT